ncbi:complement component C9-like [Melanotaenia boesemani]|uniref:complement component C9-like n=1 Tax=Melanotaenia boesemani TaxID=1250792 RepID=UPI001C04C918|nr:complement component C9-like [Melanotaenia boesemani]
MRIEFVLQLGFYSLCLTLTLLEGGKAEILPEPSTINCVWSSWSQWSSCDPCTKQKRRSRGIEVFGQFKGDACKGSIGERQKCVTTDVCFTPTVHPCKDTEFQCGSGACIKKRLQCNGDLECEDQTDEDDCDIVHSPCGTKILENNEQGRTAGYGVNILGSDPRMNPFNNDYFNGMCAKVRNPTTKEYDRLPWNVGVLNYETLVEETVSKEIYEDTHSILKELMSDTTFSIDGGFSAKFRPSEQSMSNFSGGVDASLGYSRKDIIKNITEYITIKNKSFMRIKGRVQLSTYRLRSRDLHIADEFVAHVQSLPLVYEKGIYFAFLEDYGTHYTKNGKSGGEYELVYVLNQDTIKTKKFTGREIQNCFKAQISADFAGSSISGDARIKPDWCNTKSNNKTDTKEGKAMVDQVMTSVRGGSINAAIVMRATLNKEGVMNLDAYREWARSIAEEPALISSEPEPIYNIIPVDIPDANARIANIKMAIQDYTAEYSICKCKPCKNGGTVALLDGECICLCHPLFEGLACQNFKSDKASEQGKERPAVVQEGNWACWSAWSNCSGGKQSRSRSCKTDGLVGASCRGETTSEEYYMKGRQPFQRIIMRLKVVLQLGFYSLCLTLALLEGGKAQILPEPTAVNCEWRDWSEWSSCDPCSKTKRRSRGIKWFGQFDGNECQGSIGDVQPCLTTESCSSTPITCKETEFQCDSGVCIDMNLKCNGDFDCRDGTDEDPCGIIREACGTETIDPVSEGSALAFGFNILGSESRMTIFYNNAINQTCNKVWNPTKGKEQNLPWNIELLKYETLKEETFSRDLYEDAYTLLKELLQEINANVDGGISIKFASHQVFFGAIEQRKQTINVMAKYTTIKNKSFMRLKVRVQKGTLKMRTHEPRLTFNFLEHVRSLPLTYEKGIYFAFLEEFGTHYGKSGTFGGHYDLIYVLNQDIIKEKNLTARDIENCVKTSMKGGGSDVRPEWCITTPSNTDTKNGKSLVEEVIIEVMGGSSLSLIFTKTKLKSMGVMDQDTYNEWVYDSLSSYDVALSRELDPIYNIIPVGIPDATTIKSNIKMAIQDYMAEYNVCKCKPCQNGGTVALLNGKCVCLCHPLFEGLACQNFRTDKALQGEQRPAVVPEGNWACWSAWSNCSGGKQSRSRSCKTDGLVGASCRGDTTSEEYC